MYKTASQFLERFFKPATIYKYGFNWSPMYRRTTAKLIDVSDDLHKVVISLNLNWKNRNYAGSMFGGSMLSATDPIYMIQLIQILGDDYVVWDKSVEAQYKRPAKTRIYGEFIFNPKEIEHIKQDVAAKNEIDIVKIMHLVDDKQNKIATFKKTLYIANKKYYKQKLKQRKKH
ncbi:PaaI family thioesterase [Psychroserpens sp.]|uniref:PaaI family thioesterase n=1 Tax=Psychroserpens sp. TaxID=2020870 RepID=UPI00385F8B98